MARASDPIDRFGRFLAQSEHSPLTIKNYRSDLDAFAAWFQGANGEPMEPAKITPTDLRQFKRWLVEQRRGLPMAFPSQLRAKPGAVPDPFLRSSPGRGGWTAASRMPSSARSNAQAGHETWRSSASCSTPGCGSRNCAR
jgi:hypothetical protein